MPAYYFVTTFNAINQCIGDYGDMGYQVSNKVWVFGEGHKI